MIFTLTIVLLMTSTSGGGTILGNNLRRLYSIPVAHPTELTLQEKSINSEESLSSVNSESAELNSLIYANDNSTDGMTNQSRDYTTSATGGDSESLRDTNQTKKMNTMFVPLFYPTSQKSLWLRDGNVVKDRTMPLKRLLSSPPSMKDIKTGFQEYVIVPRRHARYVQMLRPRQRRRRAGVKRSPIPFGQPSQLQRANLNLTNEVTSFLSSPPMMFFSQRGSEFPATRPHQMNLPAHWMVKKNSQLPVFEVARSIHKRRRYDVPQIECPPTADGTERFACPTADHMGRYKCILDHSMCDGFIDCPDGEDEDRRSCMFFQTTKAHLDVLADALLRWARGRY